MARIGPDVKKISKYEQSTLEEPIKMAELNDALKSTRNNVSPGVSGFSGAFYKMFWKWLQYIVLGAIHMIFEDKQLTTSQRLGIICLIPKGEKDKRYLTYWRPVTLLEISYKIISAIQPKRSKPVLDNLMGYKQKTYIPGRFISECTRTAYDIFEPAKENNLPGMMLLIYFEKDFDSVSF